MDVKIFSYKNHLITYEPKSETFCLKFSDDDTYAVFDTEIEAYQSLIMRLENECNKYFESLIYVQDQLEKILC